MSKSPKIRDSPRGLLSELEEIKLYESKIHDNIAYIQIEKSHETMNYKFDFNNQIIFQALTNLGYKIEDFRFKYRKANSNSQNIKDKLRALKIEEAVIKLKNEVASISI